MNDPKELKALLEMSKTKETEPSKLADFRKAIQEPLDEDKQFLRNALEKLKAEKPNDRSDLDRRYAICITEMEKVIGYYVTWIVMQV